jgi:hypothetical protein
MLAGNWAVIKAVANGRLFGGNPLVTSAFTKNKPANDIECGSEKARTDNTLSFIRLGIFIALGCFGITQSWSYLATSFLPSTYHQADVTNLANTSNTVTSLPSINSNAQIFPSNPQSADPPPNGLSRPAEVVGTSSVSPQQQDAQEKPISADAFAKESLPTPKPNASQSTFELLGGESVPGDITVVNTQEPTTPSDKSEVNSSEKSSSKPISETVETRAELNQGKEVRSTSTKARDQEKRSSQTPSQKISDADQAFFDSAIYCTTTCPSVVAPMNGNSCPLINGIQSVPLFKQNNNGAADRVGCVLR